MTGFSKSNPALKLVGTKAQPQPSKPENKVVAFHHYFAVIEGGKQGNRTWHRNKKCSLGAA